MPSAPTLAPRRVAKVNDVVKEGDQVKVKVLGVDDRVGSLQVGKDGDLAKWEADKNPPEPTKWIVQDGVLQCVPLPPRMSGVQLQYKF